MARPKSTRDSVRRLGYVFTRLWPWIRDERSLLAASTVTLVAGVAMKLAEPWPLKFVLDRVLSGGAAGPPAAADPPPVVLVLGLAAAAVVVISGLRALLEYRQRIGFARIGNRVLRRLRFQIYTHLHGLSLRYHTEKRSGDLLVRVMRDVTLLRDVTSTALLPLLANVLILAGMLAIVFFLQWKLALLAVAVAPLIVVATARSGSGIHLAARRQRKNEGAMAATAAESIVSIREVKALSLESSFEDRFANRNERIQKEELKTVRLSAGLGRNVSILNSFAVAAVLWYGGWLVLGGQMSAGDLVVFLAYLKKAFKPARDFAQHSGRLAKATAAGERVMEVLDEQPEIHDLPGAQPAPRFAGAISLSDVSFSYGSDRPALRGVNLEIDPGQFVVLTGPSGGGKSTLISLLLRLHDPDAGTVRIDGQDVRAFTVASLRQSFAVVLQDTALFSGTVAENIALGSTDSAPESIEHAARLAEADEFIRRMPEGYATAVGERGSTLSLGQRQRIAIARAILRAAPLVLMDEPTNGLDERNKWAVTRALLRLPHRATTVLVTHDPEIAERADLVVYLEDGAIVEAGAPATLRSRGGRFARLFAGPPSSHAGGAG